VVKSSRGRGRLVTLWSSGCLSVKWVLGQSLCGALAAGQGPLSRAEESSRRSGQEDPHAPANDGSPREAPPAWGSQEAVEEGPVRGHSTAWPCICTGRQMVLHKLEMTVASFALSGAQPLGQCDMLSQEADSGQGRQDSHPILVVSLLYRNR